MVKINNETPARDANIILPDGSINIDAWLGKIRDHYALPTYDTIEKALRLAIDASKGLTTFYGQSCVEQGIQMAEIILDLKLDQDAVAAAILTSTLTHTKIDLEKITEKTNARVSKLISGVLQMNLLKTLASSDKTKDQTQLDRYRKTFLAMASDIRVVLIKLAECTCMMRGIKNINPVERKRLAQETMDIYAPLANRLGIGQLKWELEDLSFHYIDPDTYKKIALFLAERRVEREERIKNIIARLKEAFAKAHLDVEISGRAKHIYSIYLKMKRKHLDLKNIYDVSAVRVFVDKPEDCYTALSVAHNLFEHIKDEFDDYITKPKPNGYRSIHTAVLDPDGKHFEIQIRTKEMHEEAEHGVAAHWIYKENKPQQTGYEGKIAVLRELLAWHKDIAKSDSGDSPEKNPDLLDKILEDTVYVFTPAGEIIDLAMGATPLDFAYHIHSELGHRCRGAKINGHIVPLTHALHTGDRVEIITIQNGTPSRDWLKKDAGYLKTSRARAKVSQWFKHKDQEEYVESGRHILERELSRSEITHLHLSKVAERLKFKDETSLLAALGRGSVRLAQILHSTEHKPTHTVPVIHTKKAVEKSRGFQVGDTQDLLTRIAKCCKPIPGDEILGYITQGRGVSIHKKDCVNVNQVNPNAENRLIQVSWDQKHPGSYYADLQVRAYGREVLLKEVTSLLSNAKVDLINFNSTINKSNNMLYITMTIQIHDVTQLNELMNQIKQLPNVIHVTRLGEIK